MEVRFHREGIHLPALDLWLDPEGDRPLAFLSHAHADHARGAHGRVYCTPATAELYRLRGGGAADIVAVDYGVPFELGKARLTLFPAGHILGSAQLLVEHGDQRLVYTGDLRLDEPLLGPPGEIVPCDRLVIESTYGLPIFRFLSAADAREAIVSAARKALDEGSTPVLLGYPLGRGQELVHVLSEAGVPVAAHGAVAKYLDLHARFLGRRFDAEPYERGLRGRAIVGPLGFGRQLAASDGAVRVVAVSGWALLDNARARFAADTLVPWSDHSSFGELVRYVEASGARTVDVVHGFAEPFANILRSRGFDAHARSPAQPLDREEAGS
jgi:Cft2 family RNA processing exonuclease